MTIQGEEVVVDIFEKCAAYTEAREAMAAGFYPYFRRVESAQEPEVMVGGRKMLMIGSNNYLGLTNHPRVKAAAIDAIKKYGTGCAGSRFLNGTLDLHEELEEKLANFCRKESALVFPTGYQTNLGIISAIVGKGDIVVIDKLDHASIIDGCRLSFGQVRKFNHNDMDDLDHILSSENSKGKLVVVDGVFSMEGDLANLPAIVKICKKHGARLMVDDAHGIGVLGTEGRGTAEHFGVEDDVDIIMGTYSKSLAAIGGFVAASEEVIHYIKHHARSLIFSASLSPPSVAAVRTAVDIIIQEPERRERLWQNTHKMMRGFKELGFDTGPSQTPVIPIILGEDGKVFRFWKFLHENGVFANPVISPAVSDGKGLIRTSYMATHTEEHLDRALEVFKRVGRQTGVI
jgi:8-amino-7-oxononanoate synthase